MEIDFLFTVIVAFTSFFLTIFLMLLTENHRLKNENEKLRKTVEYFSIGEQEGFDDPDFFSEIIYDEEDEESLNELNHELEEGGKNF